MDCKKCGERMYVRNTRTNEKSVRYRKYICPECNSMMVTKETECDVIEYCDEINKIVYTRYMKGVE